MKALKRARTQYLSLEKFLVLTAVREVKHPDPMPTELFVAAFLFVISALVAL